MPIIEGFRFLGIHCLGPGLFKDFALLAEFGLYSLSALPLILGIQRLDSLFGSRLLFLRLCKFGVQRRLQFLNRR